ncbi:MAG: hypothetical protein N3B13_05245, partial [Deltaproteobacteria bacterium]|nr:hypothetical protein [Deltaproteobacteria bacterium]
MRLLLIIITLLLPLSSCFVETEFAPCAASTNCPKDQYCSKTDNRCHKTDFKIYSCEESQCGENEFCYLPDRTCHLADETGLDCESIYH